MADDLTEADTLLRNHQGFENDEIGQMLARIIRELKATRVAVKDLRDRVAVLESAP